MSGFFSRWSGGPPLGLTLSSGSAPNMGNQIVNPPPGITKDPLYRGAVDALGTAAAEVGGRVPGMLAEHIANAITGNQTVAQKYGDLPPLPRGPVFSHSDAVDRSGGGGGGKNASSSTRAHSWLQPTPAQLYQQKWQQQGKAAAASGRKDSFASRESDSKVAESMPYPTQSQLLALQRSAAASGTSTTSVPGVTREMIFQNSVARSPFLGAVLTQPNSGSALSRKSVLLSLTPERRNPATTRKIRIITINQYERIMRLHLTENQQIRLLRAVNYDGPLVKYIPDIIHKSGKEFFMYDFIKKVLTEVAKKAKRNKTRRIGAIQEHYISNKRFESIIEKYNKLL